MYVASERNNSANSVSRNSILRFDASAAGSTLTATHEWNLTADLPAVGANLGIEAITWIPDSMLVANGFYDESRGARMRRLTTSVTALASSSWVSRPTARSTPMR